MPHPNLFSLSAIGHQSLLRQLELYGFRKKRLVDCFSRPGFYRGSIFHEISRNRPSRAKANGLPREVGLLEANINRARLELAKASARLGTLERNLDETKGACNRLQETHQGLWRALSAVDPSGAAEAEGHRDFFSQIDGTCRDTTEDFMRESSMEMASLQASGVPEKAAPPELAAKPVCRAWL